MALRNRPDIADQIQKFLHYKPEIIHLTYFAINFQFILSKSTLKIDAHAQNAFILFESRYESPSLVLNLLVVI